MIDLLHSAQLIELFQQSWNSKGSMHLLHFIFNIIYIRSFSGDEERRFTFSADDTSSLPIR